jgi:RecB family exonuclease
VFVGDIREGAGTELKVFDPGTVEDTEIADPPAVAAEPALRVGAPSPRERRLALRVRANEILELIEGIDPNDEEAVGARGDLATELATLAERATATALEARTRGLDPLTLRVVALDAASGSSLLDVAPLPKTFSYSQLDMYGRCPLQYALARIYSIPSSRRAGALTFGSTAHEAFERFTRERRERLARGEAPPNREDLQSWFESGWDSSGFEGKTAEQNYRQRVASLLDRFWDGELASIGEALAEEVDFELSVDVPGGAPAVFTGKIDRIDRLPGGGIEVIDYKTGNPGSQKGVQESLQLSIYALACRDALGYGTPERVTLYFTEHASRMSTTRTDAELDAARDELAAWVTRLRSGDFTATPSSGTCWRCDYRALCPQRVN